MADVGEKFRVFVFLDRKQARVETDAALRLELDALYERALEAAGPRRR